MTSPFRSQMMEAAGLALSAWQVRLRGSPARRLITGPPRMTGSSGGTAGRRGERSGGGKLAPAARPAELAGVRELMTIIITL